MYRTIDYWFTKEGIEEYLTERQKEYALINKLKYPLLLNITWDNSDPRSKTYINSKEKIAKLYNIKVVINDNTHYNCAQMVQYPHTNFKDCLENCSTRDVEGLSNPWRDIQREYPNEALWPCTARGIYDHAVWVANKEGKSLEGKTAVIIGRSDLVGRPIAQMFERLQNMTTIQCHSHTPKETIKNFILTADIVVCAVGKPNLLSRNDFRYNQYVYDVGINPTEKGIVGDISIEGMQEETWYNKCITPVPGGVGKLTVHALMHNTIDWYLNRLYYDNTYYGKS